MAMEIENWMSEYRASNSHSDLSTGLNAAQYCLLKSVRDSTEQQYDRDRDIWRTFCQRNNLPEFGAGHEPLAACLSLMKMQEKSYAKVVMLSAAIANEHRNRILPTPQ
ncbi:hypothetical protein DAPPUDRAFT_262309 [Daphnia pulex]|uniref:Uncharacterized protein n=1 Tax=Daphnia pulex TaxID=6669 RepID=E9HMP8_DAPPU|nr:hypothetical protein DAPPUDRAFT_262309 [Daphnia pulex]|eukprot:EFX66974.1 hypothetical protein DAPPUDRAFT_262309 [Daphnia pulex]